MGLTDKELKILILKDAAAETEGQTRRKEVEKTLTVHRSINLDEVLENAVDAMSRNIDGVDEAFLSIFTRMIVWL
ncbi:MAG: hypothetical protein ACM3SR_17325 [Ignavibacteriales bacterium]